MTLLVTLAIIGIVFEGYCQLARSNLRYSGPYFLISVSYFSYFIYYFNTLSEPPNASAFMASLPLVPIGIFGIIWLIRIAAAID